MNTSKALWKLVAASLVAGMPAASPSWAGVAPSVSVACLCYDAKKARYTAHMLVDGKTRSEYEDQITARNFELGTHVKLVPSTRTRELADTLKLKTFKCAMDMVQTDEVIVRISSTGGIPRMDDANGKTILDTSKWPKVSKISMAGKKPK